MSLDYEPEAELVSEICAGASDDVFQLFARRTARWKHPYMHCECFTVGNFDDLEQRIPRERAFSLIHRAAELVLTQTDPDLFIAALSLLAGLVRASDTTEMPGFFPQDMDALRERVSVAPTSKAHVYWDFILQWYRLA